ncbi:glycosyltransferase family 2 protein [Microcella sp.]|uniref:glycosyltransferase family 2 protein n=1 Tax=Microcella sp. TaxID=1913979 RepID=UPI00256C2DC7|nr:glycosyltransferase [Microcella sp.]MBX9472750.1 glycosyltransferase [Microcella sp.]
MYLPDHHPHTASARVTLVVVALGRTQRLIDCLTSLVEHEASTPFSIVCVINPLGVPVDASIAAQVDAFEVRTVEPELNLGWAGGLHVGRQHVSTELFVWVQDDMVVLPGWLDALVDAADEHPEVGAFGSVRVDEVGAVQRFNGGWCVPDDLLTWSSTDSSHVDRPEGVARRDWVTSKGLLVRTRAWDHVGGADPSLYPLTYVDLDTCSHLRAHGWGVALVGAATTLHGGDQSAPGMLRLYLNDRLTPRVHERWSTVVAQLPEGAARAVPHDCTRERAAEVEQWCAREAADIVVQFGRWAERRRREQAAELDAARDELAATRSTVSWRLTAPLRSVRALARRTRR